MTKFYCIALLGLLAASTQAFTAPQQAPSKMSQTSLMASQEDGANDSMKRRTFGRAIAFAIGSTLVSDVAKAVPPTGRPRRELGDNRVFFKGKVEVKNDEISPEVQKAKNKALILTARPKNAANLPPEIAAASRGSVPAVFTVVIPSPKSFPQSFQLTSRDITPEGDFGSSGDPYWWADEPEWEISARVDTDGSLRTRDRSDLVGRTTTSQIGENKPEADLCITVQKRGFFGSHTEGKATT